MTKKQIGKRFLQILIVLFGISFLTFGLTYLSPGDPAEIVLTECGNLPTPELLEQTRHDLALIRSFAHQIAVMYLGNIVEVIPGEDVTEHAVHPYTQALLGAQFSIHMDPTRRSRVSRVKHQVLWMYLRAVFSRIVVSIVLTDVRQRCRS